MAGEAVRRWRGAGGSAGRVRVRAWAWAAVALALAAAPGLEAQRAPEPGFSLRASADSARWSLEVVIPTGWALYAPDPGTLGLPLTARWVGAAHGEAVAAVTGPPPEEESHPWGVARVHRGRVHLALPRGPTGADGLEVRWALCRADLCVPGATRLTLPGGPGGPG